MAPPSRCPLRRWRQIGWAQGLSERYVLGVESDVMSVLPSRSRCDRLAERRWAATAGPSSHEMPSVPTTLLAAGGLEPRPSRTPAVRGRPTPRRNLVALGGGLSEDLPPARAPSAGQRLTGAVLIWRRLCPEGRVRQPLQSSLEGLPL